MKFRKKPVVIDAMQYTAETHKDVIHWINTDGGKAWYGSEVANCCMKHPEGFDYPTIIIETLEGNHTASLGDWIIKGVVGEFYPCKPDIFFMTYEHENDTKL